MLEKKDKKWYAAKVFFNKTAPIANILRSDSVDFFIPPFPSLLFLNTDTHYLRHFQYEQSSHLWIYSDRTTHHPSAIPNSEMEQFKQVCTLTDQGLTLLGDDKPEYHQGQLVRITDGPFKGIVGHVKRIKKDRRVVVAINGVVAVATTFIHPSLLEPIDNPQ